ncbi:MAG: Ig-like domain-containing protein [Actinomycetota bacterium]|nr:Ig-like domain-containing protein [Actinomycetota bacterium]
MRRYLTALLTLSIAFLAIPAMAGAAPAGGLKQLPGVDGCFSGEEPVPAGCTEARAVAQVGDVVVSPSGDSVYVSSTSNDAIAIFDRDATTGRLTQKGGILGCVTNAPAVAVAESCNLIAPVDPSSFNGPTALAMSADGKSLYLVTEQGRLTSMNRAADGTLAFNDSSNLCGDGCLLNALAVSPDGVSVYPAGPGSSGLVANYRRDTTAGASLGDIASGFRVCVSVAACGGSAQNFGPVSEVAVTPDNKQLLLTISTTNAVLAWDRAVSGPAQGDWTTATAAARCVGNTNLGGTCQTRQGIVAPQSLAFADDGATLLVGSQQSLVTIRRNPSTGDLTPDAANCFGYPTSVFSGCTAMPGASCCPTFFPARDIVSTPDGQNVYLGTESPNPALWGFSRSGGALSLQPPPLRCVSVTPADTCETFQQGNRIQEMFASSDGRNVYAGGNSRIWGFAVDRPPVCQNVSASTLRDTTVTVTLSCSDPDGDAVTYEKASDPARGTLAGVRGNQISYAPQIGTTGTDSFTYRAVGAGVPSDPATATVDVTPPNAGSPNGVPPKDVSPKRIPSTVTPKWSVSRAFTKVRSLTVKKVPAGAKVVTACKAKTKKLQKRCPFKSRTVNSRKFKAKLELGKPFAGRKLPVGTKLKITITAPNLVGKVFTYTVRKNREPASKRQCLAPGAKKPGKCG